MLLKNKSKSVHTQFVNVNVKKLWLLNFIQLFFPKRANDRKQ